MLISDKLEIEKLKLKKTSEKLTECNKKLEERDTENQQLRMQLEEMRNQVASLQHENETLRKENKESKRRLRIILPKAMEKSMRKRTASLEERKALDESREEEETPMPILHPMSPIRSGPVAEQGDYAPASAACRSFSPNVDMEISIRTNMNSNADSSYNLRSSDSDKNTNKLRSCSRMVRNKSKTKGRRIHGKATDDNGILLKKNCKCGLNFPTTLGLRRHLNEKVLNLVFYCDEPECNAKFHLDRDAMKHKKEEHGGTRRFPCNGCKIFFESKHELQTHRRYQGCHVQHILKNIGYASVRQPNEEDVPLWIEDM